MVSASQTAAHNALWCRASRRPHDERHADAPAHRTDRIGPIEDRSAARFVAQKPDGDRALYAVVMEAAARAWDHASTLK